MNTILLDFQFFPFLGRLHPLVVHLPIGFLIMALVMEYFSRKRSVNIDFGISLTLLAGAISAVLAAAFGWALADAGGYNQSSLFWHRWLGIGVAVFSILAWLVKTKKLKLKMAHYSGLLVVLLLLITVTGHFGGTLTHGSGYLLEYAPQPISKLLGGSTDSGQVESLSDPDSTKVFANIIQPLLNKNCVDCHNSSKKKGDLDLETQEAILAGGDDGQVIAPKSAYESELFHRVTLPKTSKKFMPAQGRTPLTYNEIKLIEWWINSGADFEASVAEVGVPDDIKFVLAQNFGMSLERKSYIEKVEVAQVPEEELNKIEAGGFYASQIAANNNFIEVRKQHNAEVTAQSMSLFKNATEQITWLDLSNADIKDEYLESFGDLKNLTVLKLAQNPITDEGVKALEGLPHLESLNLYGTKVTAAALESFKTMPALRKLYLWQTGINADDISQMQTDFPYLDIDIGYEFELSQEDIDEKENS
ncbi:MAG: c-type cytochrome domain-containing protein [Cyclobacteriaceae bacterium]